MVDETGNSKDRRLGVEYISALTLCLIEYLDGVRDEYCFVSFDQSMSSSLACLLACVMMYF